jgi:hypothetical protein
MSIKRRGLFYLGLIITACAIIFLAYVLFTGPYDKIPTTTIKQLNYDHPTGPKFKDIEPGDKLILNVESTEPINIVLIRIKDSGYFFNLEDWTVEHYILDAESTGGTFEHTFNSSGSWGVYFENPNPPPKEAPRVNYWGQLDKQNIDLSMHYVNIGTSIFLIIVGFIFIASSRTKKKEPSSSKQVKKEKGNKTSKKNR